MSLKQNLVEKKAGIEQYKEAKILMEKRQTFEQINTQITETENKKQRIIALVQSLRANRNLAEEKLINFKNIKNELEGAYNEFQETKKKATEELKEDISGDDDIESFGQLLEANEDDPDVKNLRAAGGRGPAKRDGEVNKAGETGKLFQAVGTLSEIKKSLQLEMPDLKLNFSSVVKDGEKISNRENSFILIDEYLKNLDQQVLELQRQKEAAYLETPEGKREALLKIDDPKYILRNVDFYDINKFYFQDEVMALSEKIGAEAIKDEYSWTLRDKLQLIAWNKKSSEKGNYVHSPEQAAIEAYEGLKKLDELSYNHDDLKKLNSLYQDALNHLESIFSQDKKILKKLSEDDLPDGSHIKRKKPEGFNDSRFLADNYIKYLAYNTGVGEAEELIRILAEAQKDKDKKNFSKDVYSPEFIHAKFERYNKFLEYLLNNTDNTTQFIKGDWKPEQYDLATKIKEDQEVHQEIGLDKKMPKTYLEEAKNFILYCGSFDEALARSKRALEPWQEEMKTITTISTAAVESCFAEKWEGYFSKKNKGVLEKVDHIKKLINQINSCLALVKTGVFVDPEFANRKIKLAPSQSNDKVIQDVAFDEEFEQYKKEYNVITREIKKYTEDKDTALGLAIHSLWQFIPGYQKRKRALNKKKQIFENFNNNKLFYSNQTKEKVDDNAVTEEIKKHGISDKEILEMKAYQKKRNDNNDKYTLSEQTRLKLARAQEIKSFDIDLQSKSDILDGQEMTVNELPDRLRARLIELTNELNTLPENELAIVNERERSIKEKELSKQTYQEIIVRHAALIKKNQ